MMNKKLAALLLVGTLGLSQGVFAMEEGELSASDSESTTNAEPVSVTSPTVSPEAQAEILEVPKNEDTPKKSYFKTPEKVSNFLMHSYVNNKYTKIGAAVVLTGVVITSKTFRKYVNKALIAVGLSSEEDNRCVDCDEDLEA